MSFAGLIPKRSDTLNLNEICSIASVSVFLMRCEDLNDKSTDSFLSSNDLLVVDRAREFKHMDIIVIESEEGLKLCRVFKNRRKVYLAGYPINQENAKEVFDLNVWGVVTHILKQVV